MWTVFGFTFIEILAALGTALGAAVIYALVRGGGEILQEAGRAFLLKVLPFLPKFLKEKDHPTPIPALPPVPAAADLPVSAGPAGLVPQLPDPVADFIGREIQISKITACLRNSRAAVISPPAAIGGQGGVGKTELAYYVAREVRDHYPDGQVQIDLRGLDAKPTTPAEAMRDVLVALIPDQKLPDNPQHLAGLYQGLLAERRVLILADNAEDSAQVASLVPKPPSAMLVTSRQPVVLPGVEAVDLDQLPGPEAETLLRGILGRDRASDTDIARLARLCGYLPLALRAAGERLAGSRALSTAAYLKGLERDRGDLRYRGKEVMAVLAESVEALEHDQAELVEKWRSLAVFPAPFDRPAAAAVGDLDADELEVLVGRNLVLFDEKEDRFRLHDLFRDLAREGLTEESGYAAAKRHSGHFLGVEATAGARHIEDKEGFFVGLRVFDRERTHIEAGQAWAAAHAEADDDAALFAQSYPLLAAHILDLRQHAHDRITWLETSAQAARKLGNRKNEGNALGNLGLAYSALGETRKAIEYYEQRLDIARETGDRRGEGRALGNLGLAYSALGETRKAIEYYEQHLAIARETGDRRGEGNALGNLGVAYSDLGETRKAIEYHEQRLAIARETGDRRGEGNALGNLGVAYSELGEPRKAIEYYEQDLAIARETGDRRGEGTTLGNLGGAYSDLGEPRKAIDYYEQHLAIARETGDRRGEGNALHNRADELAKLGRREDAIADARAALAIFEEIEDPNAEKTRRLLARLGVLPDE